MILRRNPVAMFHAAIGTAVAQLTTTTGYVAVAGFDVKAASANTVDIYIGTSTAMTTSAGSWGLSPGESKRFLSLSPDKLYTLAGSASQKAFVSVE